MKRRTERAPASADETASRGPRRGQHTAQQDRPGADMAGAALQSDAIIAGHRVIRLLGTGNRAVVYLGHSGTGSAVVLKVFRAETAFASVELDITVLTSAAAPGLVRLLDVAQLGDGRSCLVLERLTGGSLARYLVEHPSLSPGEVVTLMAPVTVALAAMHAAGFAHGSLSQATILLDASGRAVLTGFGAVVQFSALPRERVQMMRADYARLGILLQSLVDALDPAHPFFLGGSAVLRRYQASASPTGERGFGGIVAAARPDTVLGTLERDLFEWADAEPLRGFQSAAGLGVNAPSPTVPAVRAASRGVVPVSTASDHAYDDHIQNELQHNVGADLAGPGHNDRKAGFDEFGAGISAEFDDEFDDRAPRGRFGRGGDALRRVFGRWAARGRGLQPQARWGRALATVVESHPLKDAGHVLRKRLHGHRRPLLVGALGGASVLVLALTLFPVSGQAGDTERVNTPGAHAAGGDGRAGPAAGTVPAAAVPADPPADAAGPANPAPDPAPDPAHDPAHDPAAIAGDDPVTAVVALLARRADCLEAASIVCLVDVDQTGSAMLAQDSYDARARQQGGAGAELTDYTQAVPSLAERTGDLAVVALTPPSGQEKGQPASVLVVKGEGGWRLREIFDY